MDNQEIRNDDHSTSLEKSYIKRLQELQKEIPNIVLPSMGMLNNENEVDIEVKDYFIKGDQ